MTWSISAQKWLNLLKGFLRIVGDNLGSAQMFALSTKFSLTALFIYLFIFPALLFLVKLWSPLLTSRMNYCSPKAKNAQMYSLNNESCWSRPLEFMPCSACFETWKWKQFYCHHSKWNMRGCNGFPGFRGGKNYVSVASCERIAGVVCSCCFQGLATGKRLLRFPWLLGFSSPDSPQSSAQ